MHKLKNILFIGFFLYSHYAMAGGPGLGSLLNGVNDNGTQYNADGSAIPVDGGLTIVIGASLLYGAKKIKEYQKD